MLLYEHSRNIFIPLNIWHSHVRMNENVWNFEQGEKRRDHMLFRDGNKELSAGHLV